jgi:tyrosine-protein kinase Etk/Wzc
MNDLKFAFSDFIKILNKNKKIIALSVVIGLLAFFSLAVTRPVNYLLQATFRDKGKTQANIHSSLSELLISPGSSQDSEAISVMKSHFLLSKIIKKLQIQATISKIQPSTPEIDNALDNIFAEWAYWDNWQVPILADPKDGLVLNHIQYDGEIKRVYILTFLDNERFTIKSEQGKDLGSGRLKEPLQLDVATFSVNNPKELKILPEERYVVVIEPMANMVGLLTKDLVLTIDRDDKSLLKLQYKNRDRHFAKLFLNTLMSIYQQHLEDDHELSSSTQVNYLERRQRDAGKALETLMDNYVKNVSDDMSKSGFTSLQQEMDFLAANLASNQQKLTEIQLETKRLKNINCDECVHYDSYTGRGDPAIINHLLAEIRTLKQQSDSLELALQSKPGMPALYSERLLEENFNDLENTRKCLKETAGLIACLQTPGKKIPQLAALDEAGYAVSTWLNAYQNKASGASSDLSQFRDHFLSYLDNFTRLLKIQEATMQQRMRTQQSHKSEFEGITLDTSRNLYVTFIQELNQLEAEEKQHRFVVEQLKNPDFELSSLTALLHDPISHERIANATQVAINLKDENNRTQKELERLAEELELQKTFLNAHILQMADLLTLKTDLLRDKITAIQNTTLDLTHQQVSLLKKHLDDYLKSRIDNLSQEKTLLEDHQVALHQRMSSIPPKWASEQLLNHNLSLQQRFLENLANMVESKNITKNLEMVQSSPLDKAIAPLHPKPPRLMFYSFIGAILGFFGAASLLFTRTMMKGIPASQENLRLAHFHVSGSISPFQGDEISATAPLIDTDLDTLRRLIARYEQGTSTTKQAKLILIAPGNGPDFSNTLAKLFAKKGQTTLKLQLGFQKAVETEKLPGLLQYLEGKVDLPEIEEMDGFDRISAGGVSRYSEELLRSPRFIKLLDKYKPSYNWIIGVTPAKIPSAEAENLAKLFDGMVVVVTNETLQNLVTFSKILDETHKNALTFIVAKQL